MVETGVVGHGGEPVAQDSFTVRLAAERAMEIGEIDIGRAESWIEPQRRAVRLFRRLDMVARQLGQADVQVRLGPLGVRELRLAVLTQGGIQPPLGLVWQRMGGQM